MAALDAGGRPLQLAESALHQLVGHGGGEEDHQVGASQLVFQAAGGLGEHLGRAFVGLAEFFVAALHALVAAQDHNAHISLSFLFVSIVFFGAAHLFILN